MLRLGVGPGRSPSAGSPPSLPWKVLCGGSLVVVLEKGVLALTNRALTSASPSMPRPLLLRELALGLRRLA